MARRYGRKRSGSLRYIISAIVIVAVIAILWLKSPQENLDNTGPGDNLATQDQPQQGTPPPDNNNDAMDNLTSQPIREVPSENPSLSRDDAETETTIVPVTVSPEARQAFTRGNQAAAQNQYYLAARYLSDAVRLGLTLELDQQARKALNKAANYWLFSPSMYKDDPFCKRYKLAPSEILTSVQKKYDIPYQLIMRINNIKDEKRIPAGANLKVVQGPFHCVVDCKRFIMSVYLGDMIVRTYPVGLGKPGRDTPVGKWLVKLKQPNPAWTDPDTHKRYEPDDPENPLGEHWISLEGLEGEAVGRTGFGIHGTIKPDEIGKNASRGCIRLFNGDVEELFDMLTPGKSRVYVQ